MIVGICGTFKVLNTFEIYILLQIKTSFKLYLLFFLFISSISTSGTVCIAPPAIKVGKQEEKCFKEKEKTLTVHTCS